MNSETTVVDTNLSPCPRFNWLWPSTANDLDLADSDDVMVDPLTVDLIAAVEFNTPPPVTEDILLLGPQDDCLQLMPMTSSTDDGKLCSNTIYIDGEVNGSPVLSSDPNLFSAAELQEAEELMSFDSTKPDGIFDILCDDRSNTDVLGTPAMKGRSNERVVNDELSPLIPSPAQIPCAFCERKFTTKSNLTRHNRTVHPDKLSDSSLARSATKVAHLNGRKTTKKTLRLSAGTDTVSLERKLMKKFAIRPCEVNLNRSVVDTWLRDQDKFSNRATNRESNFPKMINVARKSKPTRSSAVHNKSELVENNVDCSMSFTEYGDDLVNEVVIGDESISDDGQENLALNSQNDNDLAVDEVFGYSFHGLRREPKKKLFEELIENEPKSHLHVCDTCGTEFSAKACLANHKKFTHANKLGPKLKCEACGVDFCVISQYTKHIQTCHSKNGKNGMIERNLFDDYLSRFNKSADAVVKPVEIDNPRIADKSTNCDNEADEVLKLKAKRKNSSTEVGFYRNLANGHNLKTPSSKISEKKENSVDNSLSDGENGSEEKIHPSTEKLKDTCENHDTSKAKHQRTEIAMRRLSTSRVTREVRRKRVFTDAFQEVFDSTESSENEAEVDHNSDEDYELNLRKQKTKKQQPAEKQDKRKIQSKVDSSKNISVCDTPVPAKRPRGRPRKTATLNASTSVTPQNSNVNLPNTRGKSLENSQSPRRTLLNRRVKEGLNYVEDDSTDKIVRASSNEIKCDDCGKKFKNAISVIRHRASRHCHEALQCSLCCSSVSREREHVVQHMILKHLNMIRWSKELVNSLVLASEENRSSAMLQRELNLRYCNACKNLFATMQDYADHREKEDIENPFKCSWCAMLFRSEKCLRIHQRKHNLYHCRWCKQEFTRVASLTIHQNKHIRDEDNKILNDFIPDRRRLTVVLDRLPRQDTDKNRKQPETADFELGDLSDIDEFLRNLGGDDNDNVNINASSDTDKTNGVEPMDTSIDVNITEDILDNMLAAAIEENDVSTGETSDSTRFGKDATSEMSAASLTGLSNTTMERTEDCNTTDSVLQLDADEDEMPELQEIDVSVPTVENVNGGQEIRRTLGFSDCFTFVV